MLLYFKMRNACRIVRYSLFLSGLLLIGCDSTSVSRVLGATDECYDRDREPHTAQVDSHLHFRPFGGAALPFEQVVSFLEQSGVRYAGVYGIGQMLPTDSSCGYYLHCPGVPVNPTFKNDFYNAMEFLRLRPSKVHLTLSMTFPDLADPDSVVEGIALLDREFPGIFVWMGEVNLVKQALFDNGHEPVPIEVIAEWEPFMKLLRERDIPISIHADLGNDAEPTKYLAWIREVLQRFPENKIVWMHLGLSRELVRIDPELHIDVMRELLDAYPHLLLDLSWRVVDEAVFTTKAQREAYVPFINEYSERFLPGTDFVASSNQTLANYQADLRVTSRILSHLSDEAFRRIALGENYLRLLGLNESVPEVCQR